MTPCPICGGASRPEHAPFCSARCNDRDLARWFTGAYAAPAEEEDLFDPGEDDA